MRKTCILTAAVFILLGAFSLTGKEYKLMENGKPLCEIVLPEKSIPVYEYASSELSLYLGKIGNGKKPSIVKKPTGKAYPISFAVTKDKKVKLDGFRLTVSKKGILIEHREATPVGALYGAYEILKKYGGIYWLLPAKDGEYYTVKKVISVPEQITVRNPSQPLRSGNNVGMRVWGQEWLARNNMCIPTGRAGLKSRYELQKRGAKVFEGYHAFCRLLTGETSWSRITPKEKQLFKEHPEYFPMIHGKRVPIVHGNLQPCTSNKDVIRICRENLQKFMKELVLPNGVFLLYNNDSTGWCMCPECQKLDSPRDKKKGEVTARFWTFVSAITEGLWEKFPEANVYGAAYQTFRDVPENRSLIPEKSNFSLAFNRTCWRHRMEDKNCLTNTYYDALYKNWAKFNRKAYSFDELYFAANHYLPVEENVLDRLKYYRKVNCESFPEVFTLIEPTNKRYSYMTKNGWRAIWQTMYLLAAYQWDHTVDTDALYEKINSLYYGKAWEGGMKELRKVMIKVFNDTPGCTGHGTGNPLGKMLERPGDYKKILELFAKAEKAAKTDPDKRALEHVKLDRRFFAETWEKSYKDYINNFREINAYRRVDPIKIDGVLNEKSWQNTAITTAFTNNKKAGELVPLNEQTYVRIVYEPNYIYFAIEAMEPTPDKMVSEVTKRDGEVWADNTLEILLSHPDMGANYYQFIFNAKGNCYDHLVKGSRSDKSFDYKGQIATKVLKDRWVLEAKFETDALGEKCLDGQVWKINIIRRRFVKDPKYSMASSWSIGSGHAVAAFQSVNFVGKMKNQNVSNPRNVDTRYFVNGSFNELEPAHHNTNLRNWNVPGKVAPKRWACYGSLKGRTLQMMAHPNNPKDHFVRTNGTIFQHYTGDPKHLKVTFRAKGKGVLDVWGILNPKTKNSPKVPRKKVHQYLAKKLKIDSDKWQNYSYEYKTDLNDVRLRIGFAVNSGMIDLDDVQVVPLQTAK